MAVVRFAAKRSLIAGHSVDEQITLGFATRDTLSRSREVRRSASTSLDFTTETLYFAGRSVWPIQTLMLRGAARDAMVEFLDSVEDGQVFEFAPYDGPTDSPIDYRNVVCASDGYSENRDVSTGAPASTDEYTFAFTLAEVP